LLVLRKDSRLHGGNYEYKAYGLLPLCNPQHLGVERRHDLFLQGRKETQARSRKQAGKMRVESQAFAALYVWRTEIV
jgi:hypothetical protein